MQLPAYIPTRLVRVAPRLVLESGAGLKVFVDVKASRPLVWRETGETFENLGGNGRSEPGDELLIPLPRTDVAGWGTVDGEIIDVSADGAFTHEYTATVKLYHATGGYTGVPRTIGPFVVPDGDGVYDLATALEVGTVEGDLVLVPDLWSGMIAEAAATVEAAVGVAGAAQASAVAAETQAGIATTQAGLAVEAASTSATAAEAASTSATAAGEHRAAVDEVVATNDGIMAAVAGDPDSAFSIAITARVSAAGVVFIDHGDNAAAPRVNGLGEPFTIPAIWRGTVAPVNALPGDMVLIGESVPVPVLVWSDAAGTDGPLGTTEVGGFTWNVFGGYTYEKAGGLFVCTAAGATLGAMYVTDGMTDRTATVKIAAKGTNGAATIYPRYQNGSNHLALTHVSTGDNTYMLRSRIAGTQAAIATLTGFVMTDGDVIAVDTKADGTLVIRINGVEAYNDEVATFADATSWGVGTRTATGATTVAFDDMAVYTLVS